MNAKQRFFDAAFNNEPCIGSKCINSCNADSAPKHQLTDAINSNIQNKNVLNIAEATAVSNIPSKQYRKMFFQQYSCNMKKTHIEKLQQQNIWYKHYFRERKCRVCNSQKIDYYK